MSDVHATPTTEITPGRCRWRHHWEDVDLACLDTAIPSIGLCADHFIQLAHERQYAGIEPRP